MKYRYQGPVDSSVTLKIDGKDVDVMLFRNKDVELPEDHEYTEALRAQEYLKPVVVKPTTPKVAKSSNELKGGE